MICGKCPSTKTRRSAVALVHPSHQRQRDRKAERDTKHLCSCATDSEDHNRLPVPRSKQALSRRLQVPTPTKKLAQRLDSFVRRSEKKTRAREHARQASVNERSGAVQWLLGRELTLCAQSWRAVQTGTGTGALPVPFPSLARGEIEWAEVWRAWRPREELDVALLQKRIGAPDGVRWSVFFLPPPARCVCAKARHAMWQAHVVQHLNVASKGFRCRLPRTNALQHVTAKVQPCQAVLRCQSWRTDGLEAPALEDSSFRARHSVERDMSSELCRWSTLRVCRGVSVTATSISANTSVIRSRFSGRDSSGAPRRSCLIFVLMLSSDQSGRILIEPLAQLSDVLRCPVSATTHGCKSSKQVRDQKIKSKTA